MELAPPVVEAQGLKRWMAGKPPAGISQASLLEEENSQVNKPK